MHGKSGEKLLGNERRKGWGISTYLDLTNVNLKLIYKVDKHIWFSLYYFDAQTNNINTIALWHM